MNIVSRLVRRVVGGAEYLAGGLIGHDISQKQGGTAQSIDYAYFELKPYKGNELGYSHREGFLSNFSHMKEPFHFSVQGSKTHIQLYLACHQKHAEYVENVFYASFPTSELSRIDTDTSIIASQRFIQFGKTAELYDVSEYSKGGTYVDPFKDILSVFFSIPEDASLTITYSTSFRPKKKLLKMILEFLQKIAGVLSFTRTENEEKESKEKEKDAKDSGRKLDLTIGYVIASPRKTEKQRLESDMKHVFNKFLKKGEFKLTKKKKPKTISFLGFVNLFHVPTKANQNKSLNYIEYRKLAPPVTIPTLENTPENGITLLGSTDYKGESVLSGIRTEDKFRHVYIVGKTGMGKSTLISNMVRSDMISGGGIAVLDPHGDLIEDVMAHIPSRRTNDVVVFDVSDTNYPVGFNVLECSDPEQKNLVASGVVSIFKKLYGHSRGPRLEYILRNVMLSILEYPNATLMHIVRMLTDKNFREEVLENVTDPIIMKFWRDEYDKWNEKQRNEAVGPISNKIGQFLSSTVVRNIFAQPKSKIQIRQIMDEGKILLINLSKGKIGEDNASMIGSFLVTKFQIDAMSRADIDYKQRKDFYLYIDEFQNFATDSFENILSEARKYRLSLIVANQFTSQIQENVRNAIFGNVGTIVSFGLGYDDATIMSSQFKELIEPNDLLSLPRFKAYVKLMVDGVTADPFTMGTFPLPEPALSDEIKEKIRKQSRQRYAMEKAELEQLLKVRAEKQFSKAEKVMEKVQAEAQASGDGDFSIKNIELGKQYDGYVKLKYNYGLFVTVKGVEGLLHKSQINVPGDLESRKKIYEVGDKIIVYAQEFKEVNGEKKVVWTQKK